MLGRGLENYKGDDLRSTDAYDNNFTEKINTFATHKNDGFNGTVDHKMIRQKKIPGRAGRELRRLRLSVYAKDPKNPLTYAQMAEECGYFNNEGKPLGTTYQYKEDSSTKEFFPKDVVDQLKIPLVERGISEEEVYEVLAGISPRTESSHSHSTRVVSRPESDVRDVPILSRKSVYRVARGEIKLGQVTRYSPEATQLEASEVIMGWMQLPDAGDDPIVMDLNDDRGSRVVVDRTRKDIVEGNAYLFQRFRDGPLVYGRVVDGMLYSEEEATYGHIVELDNRVPIIFGEVVWLMERTSR